MKRRLALGVLVALVACGGQDSGTQSRPSTERATALAQNPAQETITVTAEAKFVGNSHFVTPDSPAVLNVNLHTRFASIENVGYYLWFVNDPLDPGEGFGIGDTGAGAVNGTSEPQWQRQIGFDMGNPGIVESWLDGKEKKFQITGGTFEIQKLEIVVTGVPLR